MPGKDFFNDAVGAVRGHSSLERNVGRRTMFDALVYCYVMLNVKHGGHVLVAAAAARALQARYHGLRAAAARFWRGTAPRQCLRPCSPQEAWMQSLTRLETYVASMA
jgi:hypothetical protein